MRSYQEIVESELYKKFKKSVKAGMNRSDADWQTIRDARSKFQFTVEREPSFSHESLLDLSHADFENIVLTLNAAYSESMRVLGHKYGFKSCSSFGDTPSHWWSETPSDRILMMFEHLPNIQQTMEILDLFYRVDDFWFSTGTWTIRFTRQGETREQIEERVKERLANPLRIS